MSTEDERQTREQDVEAFFALSRPVLYGLAVGVLAVGLGAAAAGIVLGPEVGLWVGPLYPALAAGLSSVLRRSAAGRGAIWTLSRKGPASSFSPTQTLILWSTLTALAVAAAWLLES